MGKSTTRTRAAATVTPEPEITRAVVAIDIGYRFTKALTAGRAPVIFPSVAGPGRDMDFQAEKSAEAHPGDRLTDDEGDWFIGELAMEQYRNPDMLLKLKGRVGEDDTMGYEFRVRMAKAAIGKLFGLCDGSVIHIRLATGLPVTHMNRSAELKQALIGQHQIKTDNANFIANVVDVSVMPQPYAVIYSQMLTASGDVNPLHTAQWTGVVDVGGFTTDVALDHKGMYIEDSSGSLELGISSAQDEIATLLYRNHKQKPSYEALETCLRTGKYRVRGTPTDYTAEVEKAMDPLRSSTLALMGTKWQVGTEIDVIYVAGGGAGGVFDTIRDSYSQAVLVEHPQLAIAQGYFNYAMTIEKHG